MPRFFSRERWFDSLVHWPKTLRQSFENPFQPDRLGDTSGIELEYPLVQGSAAENRRETRWLLFLGFLIALGCYLAERWFATDTAFKLRGAVATLGVFLFLLGYFRRQKPWWRWLFYLFLPLLSLGFFYSDSPYFLFSFGLVLTALIADRFATHFFYLKTCVPLPRSRSLQLRELWRHRFSPIHRKPKGTEFYILGPLAVFFALVLLLDLEPRLPTAGLLGTPLKLALIVFVLLLIPFVLELVSSFLTARRPIHPFYFVRAFSSALVSWCTYNRSQVQAPATFQSPAGSYRDRKFLFFAALLLFSTSSGALLDPDRIPIAVKDASHSSSQEEFTVPTLDLPPFPSKENLWEVPLDEQERSGARLSAPTMPLVFCSLADEPEWGPPPAEKSGLAEMEETFELEPYQRALLETMTPEEQEAQIKEWVLRAEEERKKAEAIATQAPPEASPQTPSQTFLVLLGFLWIALFSILNSLYPLLSSLFPLLFYLSVSFVISARVVAWYGREMGLAPDNGSLSPETWSALVSRVRASNDDVERESLFLGLNAADASPVIVPRSVFKEHAHLLGDSGSGKTSLGMTSLITQLIRFGDSSLIVLDLKGDDLALFEATRVEAEEIDARKKKETPASRYRFRWFTNELHRSTYAFNLLAQRYFQTLTAYQRADIITAAMGLQYGTDYGRAYYASANSELLYRALDEHPDVASFSELGAILRDRGPRRVHAELRRAAAHLHAVVNRLSSCEAINVRPEDGYPAEVVDGAIDLADVFLEPQVIYFHLPSLVGTTSSAEIARFVLYSLLASAKHVGPDRHQVYLFIDEFQRIAANNLDIILQTARSMNVAIILANQTISDLKTHSANLIPTVRANTRFRQIFAASDLTEQQEITHSSGEALVHNRSWSEYLESLGIFRGIVQRSHTETITPRLRPNDVILASDHPLQSVVYIRRGDGYAQYGGFPFVMTSTHQIDEDLYDKRKRASWPKSGEGTFTPPTEYQTPIVEPEPEPYPDPVLPDDPPPPEKDAESVLVEDREPGTSFLEGLRVAAEGERPPRKKRTTRPQDKYRNRTTEHKSDDPEDTSP